MNAHYLRGHARRAEDGTIPGKPGDPIWFVATTEGRKADGLDLQMDRLRLERFEKNPVIGYGHDYWGRGSLPIGRGVEIEVDSPELRIAVAFDQDDDFARQVERKVRGGYLNATSVGFDAWDIDANGVPEAWELFELSVVPIPMDPDAVADVGRAAYRDLSDAMGQMRKALDLPADADPGELVVRFDDPLTLERLEEIARRWHAQRPAGDGHDGPHHPTGSTRLDVRRRRLALTERTLA